MRAVRLNQNSKLAGQKTKTMSSKMEKKSPIGSGNCSIGDKISVRLSLGAPPDAIVEEDYISIPKPELN